MIATGTKPARPAGVDFDDERVLDSDGILDLKSIPASMVVVGAGVIGVEYRIATWPSRSASART